MSLILQTLSSDDYHAKAAISNSDLTLINKSIDHYLHKDYKSPTPSMVIGSALHDRVLLPDVYKQNYVLQPEWIKRRAGKTWEAFLEENKAKTVLTTDQDLIVTSMYDMVMKHPAASKLLNEGRPEHSYFYTLDGIKCKCRPDYKKFNCLIDLKTTTDVTADSFARTIACYRYYVQAAWYMDGVNFCLGEELYTNFVFVAVESSPPYGIAVYDLGKLSIEEGRRQYKRDLNKYREYLECEDKKNYFTGVSKDILNLDIPNYVFYKNGELV